MSFRRAAYYWLFSADRTLRRLSGRVLDVGCSDGRGSEALAGADGVDIYRPALKAAADSGSRTRVVQADIRKLPYRRGSFDVAVALDVIEHFEKSDALQLVQELERVAKKVVLVTPSGYLAQPGTPEEPWQEHRCGFEPDELERLGYQVTGLGGPRQLRGDYGRFRAGPIGQIAVLVTQPFVRSKPAAAFALLASKEPAA